VGDGAGEQNEGRLLREKDPKCLAFGLGTDFIGLAPQVAGSREPIVSHLLHGGDYGCCLLIRQPVEERLQRSDASCRSVVSPAQPTNAWPHVGIGRAADRVAGWQIAVWHP